MIQMVSNAYFVRKWRVRKIQLSVEAGEDGHEEEEEVEEWGCDQVEEEVEAYMYLE